jgi:hypothetical protein
MRVKRRVHKSYSRFPDGNALFVDAVEDGREDWSGGGCPADELGGAVDEEDEVVADRGEVWSKVGGLDARWE